MLIHRIAIIAAVMFTLATATPANAVDTIDASAQWDAVASTYNFDRTDDPDVTALTTFSSAYNGSSFTTDFEGIWSAIAQALATDAPDYDGDDLMKFGIENVPQTP